MSIKSAVDLGFPHRPEEFTPQWLTKALAVRCPGAVVKHVDIPTFHTGTTGRIKLVPTYAAGSPAGVPKSVFIKMLPQMDVSMDLPDGTHREFDEEGPAPVTWQYETEVGFYKTLRNEVPVEAPVTYGAEMRTNPFDFYILLEDITERSAKFLFAGNPLSKEEAHRFMRSFARLHAKYWESERFKTDLAWLRTPITDGLAPAMRASFTPEVWREILNGPYQDCIPAEFHQPELMIKKYWYAQEHIDSTAPLTVVHGDPHLGNLYMTADGTPGFLDWQLTKRARWIYDICAFLAAAVDIENRRNWEIELLRNYLADLAEYGVKRPPTFDEAMVSYRQGMMKNVFHWISSVLWPSQLEIVNRINIQRHCAAALDHQTLKSIPD